MKDIKNLPSNEVLDLAAQSKVLLCPVCGSRLATIPENVAEGQRPLGVSCPGDKEHFYIYAEDASRVRTMRDDMRAFRKREKE